MVGEVGQCWGGGREVQWERWGDLETDGKAIREKLLTHFWAETMGGVGGGL